MGYAGQEMQEGPAHGMRDLFLLPYTEMSLGPRRSVVRTSRAKNARVVQRGARDLEQGQAREWWKGGRKGGHLFGCDPNGWSVLFGADRADGVMG